MFFPARKAVDARREVVGGFFFLFFQTGAQASKHSGHKDKQRLSPPGRSIGKYSISPGRWLSPHARVNQLQVGSRGDPIQPLVAEILNIYLLIGQGGKAAACLCGRCVCWLAREFGRKKQKKKPPRWPRFRENGNTKGGDVDKRLRGRCFAFNHPEHKPLEWF
jgi:hypothetical protein